MKERKFYVAYGSNLNLEQMAHRCPNAKVVGVGMLEGWRLIFNRVATIEPDETAQVPVGLWSITEQCERALDIYEGYPHLYRKETVKVRMFDGTDREAMVYIMNTGSPQVPNSYYLQTIEQGYRDVGLTSKYLEDALMETVRRIGKK